jgi:hypothetical protein
MSLLNQKDIGPSAVRRSTSANTHDRRAKWRMYYTKKRASLTGECTSEQRRSQQQQQQQQPAVNNELIELRFVEQRKIGSDRRLLPRRATVEQWMSRCA